MPTDTPIPTTTPKSPTPKIKNLADLKAYVLQLWNSPPLNYYTPAITAFWQKYGYYFKLSLIGIVILILIVVGINLGRSASEGAKLPEVSPPPLPTLSAPTPTPIESEFLDLISQIRAFSTLLPDPAPPSVDEKISLITDFQEW